MICKKEHYADTEEMQLVQKFLEKEITFIAKNVENTQRPNSFFYA